jgi:hypothetical protein
MNVHSAFSFFCHSCQLMNLGVAKHLEICGLSPDFKASDEQRGKDAGFNRVNLLKDNAVTFNRQRRC